MKRMALSMLIGLFLCSCSVERNSNTQDGNFLNTVDDYVSEKTSSVINEETRETSCIEETPELVEEDKNDSSVQIEENEVTRSPEYEYEFYENDDIVIQMITYDKENKISYEIQNNCEKIISKGMSAIEKKIDGKWFDIGCNEGIVFEQGLVLIESAEKKEFSRRISKQLQAGEYRLIQEIYIIENESEMIKVNDVFYIEKSFEVE